MTKATEDLFAILESTGGKVPVHLQGRKFYGERKLLEFEVVSSNLIRSTNTYDGMVKR